MKISDGPVFLRDNREGIKTLVCSSDGKWLLWVGHGGEFWLWSTEKDCLGEELCVETRMGGIVHLAFTLENVPFAVSYTYERGIYLVNLRSGAVTSVLGRSGDHGPVMSADASLIGAATAGAIGLHCIKTGTERWVDAPWVTCNSHLTISNSKALLAVFGAVGLKIFDLRNEGDKPLKLSFPTERMLNVVFSPDDSMLALADATLGFVLWNIKNDSLLFTFSTAVRWRESIGFSNDGRNIVTSFDSTISVWDVHTSGRATQTTVADVMFQSVQFSTANRIVTHDDEGVIRIYNCDDDFDPDVAFAGIKSAAKTS